MADVHSTGGTIELTDTDLRLVRSALDWLNSSLDDESVRLATGWPAVGVAWLSSTLSRESRTNAEGGAGRLVPATTPAVHAVADTVRRGLATQGFSASSATVVGRTLLTSFRLARDGGPEPRLTVGVTAGEGTDFVHAHVRVGVHDARIEQTLAELTDAPDGRPRQVTAEIFLLDLVTDDPPPWSHIAPGEETNAGAALLQDIAAFAVPWWTARDSREALIERLGAELHPSRADDRRLAVGRALAGDRTGAAEALRRHVGELRFLRWPADLFMAAFLARFADRLGVDLGVVRPDGVPSTGARTPVIVRFGDRRFDLDAARLVAIVAALGAALDASDLEFEMLVGPSKEHANAIRAALRSAVGP